MTEQDKARIDGLSDGELMTELLRRTFKDDHGAAVSTEDCPTCYCESVLRKRLADYAERLEEIT